MMKRISAKYAHFLCALLTVFGLLSCDGLGEGQDFHINLFSVAGNAFDAEDGSAITGLTVTMSAYSADDIQMNSALLTREVTTASDGSYFFSLFLDEYDTEMFFNFIVTDDSNRPVKYKSMQRGLFLSASSRFYVPDSKTYKVTGNDFILEPDRY